MRYSPLALLAAGFFVAGMAHAADAETAITFTGKITNQTCGIAINNGGTNGTASVKLKTVHASLLDKKDAVAGTTPFILSITSCDDKHVVEKVKITFTGGSLTNEGYLNNTAASKAAEGVAVQLTEDDAGKNPINPNGWSMDLGLPASKGEATHHTFAAQYVRIADDIKPGDVQASVTAEMEYL